MAHLSGQLVGSILDNYADVIDGGNAWRGSGTAFAGVPGTQSNDSHVRLQSTLTSTAAGSTTSIVIGAQNAATAAWVRTDTPRLFLRCDTGAAGSTDYARRVTGWNNTTKAMTVDAFPVAPGSGATFTCLQGFRRIPNGIDIEADGTESPHGFDRFYDLALAPTKQRDLWGSGAETWDGLLTVTLRLLKYSKAHTARESMVENLTILGSALVRGDHRDSTYVRAILPATDAPEIIKDDSDKFVCRLRLPITYRINRTFG